MMWARQGWLSLESRWCASHSFAVPASLPPRPQLTGSEVDSWPKANQWPDSRFQVRETLGCEEPVGPVHVFSRM